MGVAPLDSALGSASLPFHVALPKIMHYRKMIEEHYARPPVQGVAPLSLVCGSVSLYFHGALPKIM